jgi:hypothetical protein
VRADPAWIPPKSHRAKNKRLKILADQPPMCKLSITRTGPRLTCSAVGGDRETPFRNRETRLVSAMIECREASQLRHHAAALALASDAPAVDAILGHVGSALGLPLFGYHLDAAHPSYTDETFRKLLQQGWPREALELRWQGKGSILLRLRAPG